LAAAAISPNARSIVMAYDERLATRIRRALGGRSDFTERKMFGGLAFSVRVECAAGSSGTI